MTASNLLEESPDFIE